MKVMSDSYLYRVADYGKEIYKYLMRAERVDKKSESFADIIYDIKMRQASPIIMKVLLSNRVVLCIDTDKGMSRAFKVLYCEDVKDRERKKKAFIDCTGLIKYENGRYICKNIGILTSYIISAMTYVLYYKINDTVVTNNVLVQSSTEAFVDMMLYVLGYLKVPVTYLDNKEKISFVLAEYYLTCILERSGFEDNNIAIAKKVSKFSDNKTCAYLHTLFADTYAEGKGTFDQFIKRFAEVFLDQKDSKPTRENRMVLTPDVVAQRWMYVFGSGTFLGLEFFPSFAAILTDCYVGAYVNQQNTIEKIVGSKTVVKFTNELLKIGSENA